MDTTYPAGYPDDRSPKEGEQLGITPWYNNEHVFHPKGVLASRCVVAVPDGSLLQFTGVPKNVQTIYELGDTATLRYNRATETVMCSDNFTFIPLNLFYGSDVTVTVVPDVDEGVVVRFDPARASRAFRL